jgi:chromosome segregation ATPase
MVGALAKESRSKSERDQLAARVKEAEGLLVALSGIFGAPDLGSLPQLATQREGQRNSLKNAQVRLEEEIRLLRAELQDGKRMSCSEITSASDDIKRLKASLLRAESDRDQFEAELIFVQQQLADSATNMQALEGEVGRESSYAAQLREKLKSLSEERDDLVRQLNRAESQVLHLYPNTCNIFASYL